MKNVINNAKKGILMVALFATVISFAKEVSFNIINEAGRTTLAILNVKRGNLLSIKDNNGVTLYKETIDRSGTYTKGFDLTSLPDGAYFFEVDKDVEIRTIPFTVKSSIVAFNKEKTVVSFKPVLRIKDNRLLITKLALGLEPLKIKLYYETNKYGSSSFDLIHSEEIQGTKTIERAYKLDKNAVGLYKIVFTSEDREFVEYFKI